MTDVTVAPPGGAPAAATTTPPANEVAIDTNHVHTPTPVGSQAPDKPVGDFEGSRHRPQSRREAIKAAFDRATKQQDEGAQRQPQRQQQPQRERSAAEAKPGHNNPPADRQQEQRAQGERRDIQPGQRGQVGQGQPERQQQHREQGRFARPPETQAANQQAAQQSGQQQAAAGRGNKPLLPHTAAYREPLRRMSPEAKNDWHDTPESVRGAVYKLAQEFTQGYQRQKADIDAFTPVKRFHEMAQQQGTTLEKALHNYVSMEQKLREDVVGGLDVIVSNLNLRDPQTGRKLDVRDVAYHILNMSPDQHRLSQQQNAQAAANNQIGQLHQQIASLQTAIQQMHTAQQFSQTRSAVDQFADQHPRLDELGDLIEQELKFGFTLDQAYQRAELLRPSTQAAQTRTTSAQTRQPDRSISGSPDSAPNGAAARQRKGPPPSRRDAIQNAIRRVNGGL